MRTCPFCSSQIQEQLSSCPYCNENLLRHATPAPVAATEPTSACPHCGESIPAKDIRCRYCSLPTTGVAVSPDDRRTCPYCGESILMASVLCRFCGSDVTKAPPDPNAKMPCPVCKEPIAASDTTCRYCGNDVRAVRPAAADTYVEWERPGRNVFARWWTTWAGSQFSFEKFWQRVPYSGGLGAPMKFALFFYVQMLGLAALCYTPIFIIPMIAGVQGGGPKGWSPAMIAGAVLGGILVLIPVALLLCAAAIYMTALIYHGCVLLLGGRGDFEVTFRVVAYSYGSRLWDIACCVATIIFQTMSMTHGFRIGHGLSKSRAMIAALIPQLLYLAALATPYVIMVAQAAMR